MNKGRDHGPDRPRTKHKKIATAFQRPDAITQPLDVIVTVFNSARFRSRWKHYEDFITQMDAAGSAVRVWTVEVAFGHRQFAVTDPRNERHLQLRTRTEIWHKERSQNLMLRRVLARHPNAEYFAFIDADISFARHDWADETVHALQHFDVVQMWQFCHDLDAKGNVIQNHRSFADCYLNFVPWPKNGGCFNYYDRRVGNRIYFHPGYAWAYRRSALEGLGGLIDWAILGSADFHMAYALVGHVGLTLKPGLTRSYRNMMLDWERQAEKSIDRRVGCVPGSILHHWHGHKADRQYQSRWKILEKTKFDPKTDLVQDIQGLYRLQTGTPRLRELRDLTRRYFHQRNEDAV